MTFIAIDVDIACCTSPVAHVSNAKRLHAHPKPTDLAIRAIVIITAQAEKAQEKK
jgi:hypothetical protein